MPININVKARMNKANSSIKFTGSEIHIITEKEQALFGLNENSIKRAVETFFGKKPNDVFLHSPTPWKDLYTTYNWPQVQALLNVKSADIIEITSQPVIVAQNKLSNNSSQPAVLDASISQQLQVTSESNWSKTDELGVSQSIEYGFEMPGVGNFGGSTTFSYSHTFGEGGSKSQAITVGSSSGATVTLDPHEAVKVLLSATRGVMKIKVVYQLSLTGCIAINYSNPFKDHHFHALDVEPVMKAAGMPATREYTEIIEVGFYSKATTDVQDLGGNKKAAVTSSAVSA